MNLKNYRASASEQERTADLLELANFVAATDKNVLDIGARDGHFAKLLAPLFALVTALDLDEPEIHHEKVRCVKGDLTALEFGDDAFDFVLCAEVLEHIPPQMLKKACSELSRVTGQYLLIGVPYRQDIRVGRTTCGSCGKKNPPWGHVNTFDEQKLHRLFPGFETLKRSFVGTREVRTNFLSAFLMDLAGNPYGVYSQAEPCIQCGKKITPPPPRTFWQKVATRIWFYTHRIQQKFVKPQPKWIHLLLEKQG